MTASTIQRVGDLITPIVIFTLLIAPAAPCFAQQKVWVSADSSSFLAIPEVGASIVESPDGLRVSKVTPASARAEKYRDVDIKKGDRIVSINGQRISTIAELRKALAAVKVGEQVRMGSLRSDGPVIATYMVGSAEDLQVVSVASEEGGAIVKTIDGGHGGQRMITIKAEEGSVPCLDLGCVLMEKEGLVVVSQMLPLPPGLPAAVKLKEGDVIKSIQNETVTKSEVFMERYDAVDAGERVTIVVESDGKEDRMTFTKPKIQGSRIIKTK